MTKKCCCHAMVAIAACAHICATAQEPPPEPTQLDTVEVTGSRLKQVDAETASPVQVLTRDDLVRIGAVSLQDLLQRLPANNAGAFNQNDDSYGAAAVSLRGLGAGATLILINGRRVPPFGFSSGATFVDVNQIPVAAIERVEVLLDGASAIYGSDAIAGVVNVILRRDFKGIQASAGYGTSTYGDAGQKTATLLAGAGDRLADGYNAFAGYSHSDQNPVLASARDRSSTADYRRYGLPDFRSTYAYPGNLYSTDGTTFLQPLGNCAPQSAGNPCLYDAADYVGLIPRSRRDTAFAAGTAGVGAGFELFGDAEFSHTSNRQQSYSLGNLTYFLNGTLASPFITLPVGHPQNPYPTEVALQTRFADQPLFFDAISDTQRIVVGARNEDFAGWDVETGLLWAHSRTPVTTTGVIDDAVLTSEIVDANGVASTSFHFGDPSANDPDLMHRLYPTLVDIGRTQTSSIDLRGRRDLIAMPGGAAQLALGVEFRSERYASAIDPRVAAGNISALSGTSAAGDRTIASGYTELLLPATKSIEATLAARFDRYSDFGSTTNPKIGLKWKPASNMALRATYQTAFRAPAFPELSPSPVSTYVDVEDPRTCPIFDASNPNCGVLYVPAVYTGNLGLRPERAYSATAGLVLAPWRDASLTLDAFRITRRGDISVIDPDYLLAHENQFPSEIVRNPDGSLRRLQLEFTNLGKTRVWGLDVAAKARATVSDVGRFGLDGSLEWLPHYELQQTRDGPVVDDAGTYEQPKARARLAFTFERNAWLASLAFNYTDAYQRAYSGDDVTCPYDSDATRALCSVKPWETFDLFLRWNAMPTLKFDLVVENVGNVQAPVDDRNLRGSFTAYDPTFHSAVGRFFQLTATYTLH